MINKIITIVGARPQFVKAATISRALSKTNIKELIVHTGQHFDENMSKIFFDEMDIPVPHYNLDINGVGHGAMTGRMLEQIEVILQKENPDLVLVYGDTNSTIAGALAAKKLHIKVAHVEAGLRSFNMDMPEEINRILTDRISDYLFCPTQTAVDNLKKEGYDNIGCQIYNFGDVMYDAAMYYSKISSDRATFFKSLKLPINKYVLCTIHRQENTDNPQRLEAIIDALNTINKLHKVVVPLHPRTRNILKTSNIKAEFEIIDPVGYFDMIELIKNSILVMTDSGGLQKEAYFFGKYCITMRDETEWVELVQNGFNITTGANKEDIAEAFETLLTQELNSDIRLYGDGDASEKIVEIINNSD
jgi:UDP-GlcNAc3NAcA epimerase